MDATLSDPLVDRLLDGRYAVEARLARGGMASVYLATDVRLERRVAVKVMHPALAEDPEFVARFNREARAAACLSHASAVAVYDQGSDDGHIFLVMEYIAGSTLRDVLRERGRLAPAEAVAVMDHVLAALGAAHAAGLVHRDIKPENVLVTADGRVKVADFGLARAVAGTTLTTDDSSFLGTAAYVSPEQVRDGVTDERSDVYSAGVLLFELLTGAAPFRGDSPMAVAYRHMTDDVPAPSSVVPAVPAALDDVVRRATARDPGARFANGAEMHRALVDVRDRLGLHAGPPAPTIDLTQQIARPATASAADLRTAALPAPPVERPPRRRRRWPYAVVALVLLASSGAFAGWWFAIGRYVHAPRVVGMSRTEATAKLDHLGLRWRFTSAVFSSEQRGLVATETPDPGSRVTKGQLITLAVSKGPATSAVPDVHGDSVSVATASLKAVNLVVGDTRRIFSSTVRKGLVVRTDPAAGQVRDAGSKMTLFVSRGVRPIRIPDVQGQPPDRASQELTDAGFTVGTTTHDYSDTIPAGDVINTDPPAGTFAKPGTAIGLVVSKGPHLYPVPSVTGMKLADAEAALQAAGFAWNVHNFPGGPDKVLRQSPGGGSMQKRGTVVTLFVF